MADALQAVGQASGGRHRERRHDGCDCDGWRSVYTGTHDNDTVAGWWNAGVGNSTRSAAKVERERERALAYVGGDGSEIHWDFVRTLLVSVADTAIVPLQDVLGIGSEGRMNLPGRSDGNRRWRFAAGDLTPELRRRLRPLAEGSGRCPAATPAT